MSNFAKKRKYDDDVTSQSRFLIDPKRISDYRKPYPSVRQPQVVGTYSLNGERKFCDDNSELKYLRWPDDLRRVNLDLNSGINEVIRKSDFVQLRGEKLDNMLEYLLNHKEDERLHGDVVCFRGLLTLIACTPYEFREPWSIGVTLWNGTLYMCQFLTDKHKRDYENQTEIQKTMCSWGYKFEQYLLADSPTSDPVTSEAVNENEEFIAVIKTSIGDTQCLIGAEMDGIDSSLPIYKPGNFNPDVFIELKTSKICDHWRVERSLRRFKFMKWFVQSYLCGCPRIITGFRNDEGVVKSITTFLTKDLPKRAQDWEAEVCLNFLDEFLSRLRREVVIDDPRVIYQLDFIPNQPITCRLLQNTQQRLLPEFFIEAHSKVS